ncbi:P2 family phage major capsid protein [Escherichia coli]|nr:P2 family phage major capsid protein [Escherichia coli]
MIISQKRMGGLQAVRAPFFPPNALLITRLDNLSILLAGRHPAAASVIDNPKRDRIENFESVNEAYVVEDYRLRCTGGKTSRLAILAPPQQKPERNS